MSRASTKGIILQMQLDILLPAIANGSLARETLDARLGPEAHELLETKIVPTRWYPAAAVAELLDASWELCLDRNVELALAVGRAMVVDLLEQGRYQQLEYAVRGHDLRNATTALRHVRLVGTMVLNLFDFLDVQYELVGENPLRLRIIYGRADAYTEHARYVGQGFITTIVERMGVDVECTSERTRPDQVHYDLVITPKS